MTEQEIQDFIEKIKETEKEVTSSKKKAREFLYRTGLYTKDGELKEVVK